MHKPEILAPAGDRTAFLAGLAAGADALYLGLKNFSARMQAENFSIKELAGLNELARTKGAKLYVAMNSLVKPGDVAPAGRLIDRLARTVSPAGLIVQDLGMIELARQAGFKGEIHISTLANLSHPAGLALARELGASRAVLPREFSIDEIKTMAQACPDGLGLEVFVHGALCFCVSGRCYWSSYLGGKSGLRGRCVQPCRRTYGQRNRKAGYFSCLDLSLDFLVKSLSRIEAVKCWKIEGRKKGAHYVYYTTAAYKLFRDNPNDPQAKKEGLAILERALGRPGTHYTFLPQKPHPAVSADLSDARTDSGLLAGKTMKTPEGAVFIKPRLELIPGDFLRIGREDDSFHTTLKIRSRVPKGGRLDIKLKGRSRIPAGAHVFLIDRREPELIKAVRELDKELSQIRLPGAKMSSEFSPALPAPWVRNERPVELALRRSPPRGKPDRTAGFPALWLGRETLGSISRTMFPRISWWLPPVIWPDEEQGLSRFISQAVSQGAARFVLNSPWQIKLFPAPARDSNQVRLTAGPFCNTANPLALESLRRMGFSSAIVSPELAGRDILDLPPLSPLPLGIVLSGFWPVGISRIKPKSLKTMTPLTSPKGENFWTRAMGQNLWIYPGWPLDLSEKKGELERAGYVLFVNIIEPRPKSLPDPGRTSLFNWDAGLL